MILISERFLCHISEDRSDTMFSRVPITPNPDYFTDSTNANAPSSLDISSTAVASSSSVSDAMASPLTDELAAINSDWWSNAIEEDSFYSPLPFDASESGLWNGRFVPPPPRPPFWDDTITSDGLTTCDLCTWALHERNAFSLDGSISGEFLLLFYRMRVGLSATSWDGSSEYEMKNEHRLISV